MSKKENKTIRYSVRLISSDSEALRRLSPKNVSYAIRNAIQLYLNQPGKG
jgi:hypothetical protein